MLEVWKLLSVLLNKNIVLNFKEYSFPVRQVESLQIESNDDHTGRKYMYISRFDNTNQVITTYIVHVYKSNYMKFQFIQPSSHQEYSEISKSCHRNLDVMKFIEPL